MEKKFDIKETQDWYRLSDKQIRKIITMSISDVMSIVKKFYPDLNMKYFQFGNSLGLKKSQYTLKSMLQTIFPTQEIVEEYRHVDLENLELDYYLPQLKLAFEYQVCCISFIYFNLFLFLFLFLLYFFIFLLLFFLLTILFYYFIIFILAIIFLIKLTIGRITL